MTKRDLCTDLLLEIKNIIIIDYTDVSWNRVI